MREAERMILLRTVDSKWMEHIDLMDDSARQHRHARLCPA